MEDSQANRGARRTDGIAERIGLWTYTCGSNIRLDMILCEIAVLLSSFWLPIVA
jgi:hypothetical protein